MSTSLQRQRLSIAVFKPACCDSLPQGLPRTVLLIKRQPTSNYPSKTPTKRFAQICEFATPALANSDSANPDLVYSTLAILALAILASPNVALANSALASLAVAMTALAKLAVAKLALAT